MVLGNKLGITEQFSLNLLIIIISTVYVFVLNSHDLGYRYILVHLQPPLCQLIGVSHIHCRLIRSRKASLLPLGIGLRLLIQR